MQRRIPVITTFHGSDINNKKTRWVSNIVSFLSKDTIYVTREMKVISGKKKGVVIPCGVDLSIFVPTKMRIAKEQMNLDINKNYILFCSSYDNPVKNAKLAIAAFEMFKARFPLNIEMLELNDFNRKEVSMLLNASHCLLMTSFSEGSPQVIKEALATNRPIVSTAVGSVEDLIKGVNGCNLVERDLESVSKGIARSVLHSIENGATNGRDQIESKLLGLNNVASRIQDLYENAQSAKNIN